MIWIIFPMGSVTWCCCPLWIMICIFLVGSLMLGFSTTWMDNSHLFFSWIDDMRPLHWQMCFYHNFCHLIYGFSLCFFNSTLMIWAFSTFQFFFSIESMVWGLFIIRSMICIFFAVRSLTWVFHPLNWRFASFLLLVWWSDAFHLGPEIYIFQAIGFIRFHRWSKYSPLLDLWFTLLLNR